MLQRFAEFELDTVSYTLRRSGRTVDLPPKAVHLLALLVDRTGSVVTKAQLLDALWPEGFIEESNLTQHVYLLRRAFREHGSAAAIETVPRRGYSLSAPASRPARSATLSGGFRYAAGVAAAVLLLILAGASAARSAQPLEGQALHAYQLGRYFWNLRSPSGMLHSLAYFRGATHLAPRSALAYAGLADAYTELADFNQPCAECRSWQHAAERAASHSLALDPSSAEAHVAYAMVRRVFYGDERAAAREFRIALQFDPHNALANQWYGNMRIAQGFAADGIAHLRAAAAEQPISTATYAWLARGYYYQRRYTDAEQYAREALALEPTRLETVVLLGLTEEARGNFRQALERFDRARSLGIAVEDANALRAGVYAAMGRRDALKVLHGIAARRDLDLYAMRDVVIGLAIAGDTQEARRSLARIRYRTRLDRELMLQDPHIRVLR